MSMYETGTITAAKNSTTITGSGTAWLDKKFGISPQCVLVIRGAGTVDMYAIQRVDSNTQLTVTRPIATAVTGAGYGIIVAESMSVQAWANQLAASSNYTQSLLDSIQTVMTGTGSVVLTAPNGQQTTVSSFKKLTDDMGKKLESGDFGLGTDITEGTNVPGWGVVSNTLARMPTGFYNGLAGNWGNPPGAGSTQRLKMINVSADGGWGTQIGTADGPTGGKMWLRCRYNSVYSDWDQILTQSQTGWGVYSPASLGPRATNATDLPSGLYWGAGNDIGTPGGVTVGGFSILQLTGNSPMYRCQLAFQDGGGGRIYIRSTVTGAWASNGWLSIYTTGNTTKSSDGTLKAASPVCRIVSSQADCSRDDVDEAGFTWCGSGTANSEAEGITINREGMGVYSITGARSLAIEGWQLLPPRNPQGGDDLGVVTAEQQDGKIFIRLFRRKMILEDGEIHVVAGEPIDVPASSWIDVRLTMPDDSIFNRQQAQSQDAQAQTQPQAY
ncbi:hypothetical protein TUM12370_24200 [Salmonella enterica subsp. enterica serovar Choleraesuis]|nr:hypothetical protein TUM12370_24200 [Salmonella enterica subsp. enterica serovar Choleraesuis]